MKKTEGNKQREFFCRCSNFFEKGFWVIPAVSLLTSLWFPLIIKTTGYRLGILNEEQDFTVFGIIVTILVMAAPVVLTVLKTITEKYYDDKKALEVKLKDEIRHNDLFSIIIKSFDNLCEKKEQKIVRNISNSLRESNGYDPHEQVENILKEIDENVSYLLSDSSNRIKSSDLYVTLYYSFDEDGDWHCANTSQKGMPTDELLTNDNTTFKYLLNEKTSNYVFYNSKERAKSEHHYVADDLDRSENGELVGSIAGYRFSITSNEKKYIDMILFLTTYGKKFVDIDDKEEDSPYIKNAKANIEKLILEKYSRRIKIELGTWYLNNHT